MSQSDLTQACTESKGQQSWAIQNSSRPWMVMATWGFNGELGTTPSCTRDEIIVVPFVGMKCTLAAENKWMSKSLLIHIWKCGLTVYIHNDDSLPSHCPLREIIKVWVSRKAAWALLCLVKAPVHVGNGHSFDLEIPNSLLAYLSITACSVVSIPPINESQSQALFRWLNCLPPSCPPILHLKMIP